MVDQLRASSNIVTLLTAGARAVVPTASLAEARRLARAYGPGAVKAGEYRVVRPPGFDLGNSPVESAQADVAHATVFLSTRNGTAVLRSLPEGATVFIGCLLNAGAVARAALARAQALGSDIGIVCAGRLGAFALDDAIAAGCIMDRIIAATGQAEESLPVVDALASRSLGHRFERSQAGLEITDGALGALNLWRYATDVRSALRSSRSGHILADHQLLDDLEASLEVDSTTVAPFVERGDPPRIVSWPK